MSFSWKGLLGVSPSPSAGSQAGHSAHLNGATGSSSASPAGQGAPQASASMVGSSAMTPSTSRPVMNANPFSMTQPPAPTVSLFGGMVSATASYSTSYIGPSTPQSVQQARKPAEIPINHAEGGGFLLGMENFGNTCYVNSILQSLYFCRPFRDSVLSYKAAEIEAAEAADKGQTIGGASTTSDASKVEGTPVAAESPDALEGVPPPDTLFASLRDLFEVIRQSSHQKALSSPTTSTAPSSLPLASPISPSAPVTPANEQSGVGRKTSILGRPSTAGGGTGRGGVGNHASPPASGVAGTGPLAANGSGSGGAVAIPITPGSTSSNVAPTLSVSTSSVGTQASAVNAVDSTAVKAFLNTLKRENVLFDSNMHQDAHEMLNFVLNKVGEDLIDADRSSRAVGNKLQTRNPYLKTRSGSEKTLDANRQPSVMDVGPNGKTCVHRLFEGVLTNETRCLTCETVTSRDECFLDLSIDIEQNSSVSSCLRQFSASEMLQSRNKFFCDSCSGLQEAEKRMKIKKLPNVLALHLKRFKYEETVQRYVKLAYRVVFPLELRLFNTSDDADDPDRLYELFAIVVHIGAGPHHGHYIAVVKVGGRWIQFDDDAVTYIDEEEISKYYGDRPGLGSAYVLFYQAVDLDFQGLGLEKPVPPPTAISTTAVASSVAVEADRGRLGLSPVDGSSLRNGLSPERSGSVVGRSRLGSVTEGSAAPFQTGSGDNGQSVSSGSGSSGWFGSFRNREKRAGSQSFRRPKTTSSAEPNVASIPSGITPSFATSASLVQGLSASEADGTSPETASVSTTSTHANDAAARTALPSAAMVPSGTAGAVPSAGTPETANGVSGEALANIGRTTSSIGNTSTQASESVNRATTESPSESRYNRMMLNQAEAVANRAEREQNLLRAQANRRMRAASEGMPTSNVLSEAPVNGGSGRLIGGGQGLFGMGTGSKLVSEPIDHAGIGRGADATPTMTSTTLPVPEATTASQPPAFSALERPISKKEQKALAKSARRASSHHVPGSSVLAEKKEGLLSNLFSSSGSSSSSKRHSVQQSSGTNSTGTPITGGSTPADESGNAGSMPTRKASISTRTLSKTFGFGKK